MCIEAKRLAVINSVTRGSGELVGQHESFGVVLLSGSRAAAGIADIAVERSRTPRSFLLQEGSDGFNRVAPRQA